MQYQCIFTIPDGTWSLAFTTRAQFSAANPAVNGVQLYNVTAAALVAGVSLHVVQRIDSSSSFSICPSAFGIFTTSGTPDLEMRVTTDTSFTQMGANETVLTLLRLE